MSRPKQKQMQIALRVPAEWLEEADELVEKLRLPGLDQTRSDILRRAIAEGCQFCVRRQRGMNGSRKSSSFVGGASGEDYGLLLKAIEIVEIAKCRPADEAQALVVDLLKEALRASPRRVSAKHISGCMAAIGACSSCKDETRLFRRPSGALICGACAMDELLLFMQSA